MYNKEAHEKALEKARKLAAEGSEDTWEGRLVVVT